MGFIFFVKLHISKLVFVFLSVAVIGLIAVARQFN